jgi:hypothetical protein
MASKPPAAFMAVNDGLEAWKKLVEETDRPPTKSN